MTFPKGIKDICYFQGCTSLNEMTIPDSVTTISSKTFSNCFALTSVTIPNGVTSIEKYAFYGCTALKDVYYLGTQTQWQNVKVDADGNAPFLAAAVHCTGSNTQPATPDQPAALSGTANPSNNSLSVNGQAASTAVYKINGNNYFKLRDVAALLNGSGKQFNVGYDAATKSAAITTGQGYEKQPADLQPAPAGAQKYTASKDAVLINGNKAELTAYKINGANYFKLRDLGQALDFYVGYDNAAKSVFIDTSRSYDPNS